MEIEDIERLFSKIENLGYFGEFVKFKAGLREWRNQIGCPLICDKETISTNTSSRILEWLEKISDELTRSTNSRSCSPTPTTALMSTASSFKATDIANILNVTVKGQLVLSFFERKGYLDGQHQKDLTHCIVDYFIANKKRMSYSDMSAIAKGISEKFPTEKEV